LNACIAARATIWLTDMTTFDEMNDVWERWIAPGAAPARATVLSPALAGTAYKVEIGIIAARD
jgi:enamine deaminase RidA (YjgF/YER057c/UK114 family)